MIKKITKLFILPIIVLFTSSCFSNANFEDFAWLEYTDTAEYTAINFATLNQKITMKDDFILVYGSEGCNHCIAFKATIKEYIQEYKQKIYYFASEDMSSLSVDQKKQVNDLVDTRSTPSIGFIVNGESVYQFVGNKSLKDFYNLTNKYYITSPKILSYEEVKNKRDLGEEFVLLIARPDCGTCRMFYENVFNKYLYKFPGKFFMFDTKPYRDPTVVTTSNPTPSEEAIALYQAIRAELEFNWTPTLVAFKNKKISDRFQWLDNNYYDKKHMFIYYDEKEYNGEVLPAIPTTNKDLDQKTYANYEKKTEGMTKHYNKLFDRWIAEYYK